MKPKKFRDDYIYFLELDDYVGPVTLMYRKEMTIFGSMGNYIIEIEGKYYKIIKVKYKNKEYLIDNFVAEFNDVLGM